MSGAHASMRASDDDETTLMELQARADLRESHDRKDRKYCVGASLRRKSGVSVRKGVQIRLKDGPACG